MTEHTFTGLLSAITGGTQVKMQALEFKDSINHCIDREFRHPDKLKFRSPDYVLRGFKNESGYLYQLQVLDPLDKPDVKLGFAVFIKHSNKFFRTDNLRPVVEHEYYYDWLDQNTEKCHGLSYRAGIICFRDFAEAEAFIADSLQIITDVFEVVIKTCGYTDHITSGLINNSRADVVGDITIY